MDEVARIEEPATGRALALTGGEVWVLGRSLTADMMFDDPGCSRHQARLRRDGEDYWLEPLSKGTPTCVNGRPCSRPRRLRDGDTVGFASVLLRFGQGRGDEAQTTLAPPRRDVAPADGPRRIPLDRTVTLGRAVNGPDDIALPHPSVSRRHLEIAPTVTGHQVRDLGSTNGTFVNGDALTSPRLLRPGDRIDVGPFSFVYDGIQLEGRSRRGNVDLQAHGLCVEVADRTSGRTVRLLDRVDVAIGPCELVCIIGASGSGKSTMMNLLSARAPASAGRVTLNGLDLHANFDALKQDISFVPQSDILHESLTLREALGYAAELRLPPDLGPEARAEIINQAAASVDLAPRLDMKIASLSGGQKKRASLACEILNNPSLLFLDEVTSGLDESTDREVMHLLRSLADSGMTIVCVTHTLVNIEEFCDRVVVLAPGGLLVFDGAPHAALNFFAVTRLGQVFERLESEGGTACRARFERDRCNQPPPPPPGTPLRASSRFEHCRMAMHQLGILIRRGTRLLLTDQRGLTMAACQSMTIGTLVGWSFADFGADYQQTASVSALVMLLGLSALWLGCNTASKDIVGELAIYRRERDVNLSTAAYILSKFVVTGSFTLIQTTAMLLLAGLFAERMPGSIVALAPVLWLAGLLGTSLGLVISSVSNSRDQANTLVPLALVPQFILSGAMVPHPPAWIDLLSKVMISGRWITETLISVADRIDGPLRQFDLAVLSSLIQNRRMLEITNVTMVNRICEPIGLGLGIMSIHTFVFLTGAFFIILFRYKRR